MQAAQKKYKKQHDKKAKNSNIKVGDWVMVYFPHEETGKNRKLSRPWHGPYRVLSVNSPDITVSKVYFAQDGQMQIHLTRAKKCPAMFPHGFYWYGTKRHGPGRPPKWVAKMLDAHVEESVTSEQVEEEDDSDMEKVDSDVEEVDSKTDEEVEDDEFQGATDT